MIIIEQRTVVSLRSVGHIPPTAVRPNPPMYTLHPPTDTNDVMCGSAAVPLGIQGYVRGTVHIGGVHGRVSTISDTAGHCRLCWPFSTLPACLMRALTTLIKTVRTVKNLQLLTSVTSVTLCPSSLGPCCFTGVSSCLSHFSQYCQ